MTKQKELTSIIQKGLAVSDVIESENCFLEDIPGKFYVYVLGAGLVGGLGIVPGANIGLDAAVFEAVHGTAPDIAGMGLANPTALVQSGVMLLHHIGEDVAAKKIEQGLLRTFAKGIRTVDLGGTAGTEEFTRALCDAVGSA